MEKKIGRPQTLHEDDIKKSRTVSLTNNEFKLIKDRFGSLTSALLTLLVRNGKSSDI